MWRYIYSQIMDLSTVSAWEYITFIGHYNRTYYKPDIDPRLLSRGFNEEQLKALKVKLGTGGNNIQSLNLKFTGDIRRFEHPHFSYILRTFHKYNENGTLPFSGGHVDQPSKIIDYFSLAEALYAETKERQIKEQEREARKQARKNGRR